MNNEDFAAVLRARRTAREFSDASVPIEAVKRMLWAAQGITSKDGKRTAPSAHALHPLQLLFCAGNIQDLSPGVYSASRRDPTELTACFDCDVRRKLEKAALEDQPWIENAAGVLTICADLVGPSRDFADQPPYGVRGLRYVYMEATCDVLQLEPPLAPILHMCFGRPAQ